MDSSVFFNDVEILVKNRVDEREREERDSKAKYQEYRRERKVRNQQYIPDCLKNMAVNVSEYLFNNPLAEWIPVYHCRDADCAPKCQDIKEYLEDNDFQAESWNCYERWKEEVLLDVKTLAERRATGRSTDGYSKRKKYIGCDVKIKNNKTI